MKTCFAHIHTICSYDCFASPSQIVDEAYKKGANYLIISDHDSFYGSKKARNHAEKKCLKIEIPFSAEINTDIGDILVTNVQDDFPIIRDHKELCREVKKQYGCTILTHPYASHQLEKIDYSDIDFIEIFNSRSTMLQNRKAALLARNMNKKVFFGCDAHFISDIDKVLVLFNGETPFTSSDIIPIRLEYSSIMHRNSSQMIKGLRKRNPKLALFSAINVLRKLFK